MLRLVCVRGKRGVYANRFELQPRKRLVEMASYRRWKRLPNHRLEHTKPGCSQECDTHWYQVNEDIFFLLQVSVMDQSVTTMAK